MEMYWVTDTPFRFRSVNLNIIASMNVNGKRVCWGIYNVITIKRFSERIIATYCKEKWVVSVNLRLFKRFCSK